MPSKVEARLFGTLDIDTAFIDLPKSKNVRNGVKDERALKHFLH
jgi:hypothetical protein